MRWRLHVMPFRLAIRLRWDGVQQRRIPMMNNGVNCTKSYPKDRIPKGTQSLWLLTPYNNFYAQR